MSNNRTKNLVKETAWFALGNFGSKILSLLLVPLYTSILSTSDYGNVDILNTTIALAIPLLTLSLQDAAFRYAMEKDTKKESVITDCLLVTFCSPLVLFPLYPLLRWLLPVITDYWWYFFAIYAFNSVSSVLSCYLNGIGKSNVFAIQGVIHTFVFASSNVILLVFVKMGVEGYLLSLLVSHVASCVFMFFAGGVFRHLSVRFTDRKLLKEMLRYSLPLIPASVAWWIMTSIDRYMLLYMCGSDANGLYSVAHKLPTVISVITTFFINAWQITAVRSKDDADISEYTSRIFTGLFIVGSVFAFGMILGAKLLGRFFFAKDFFQAWTMMPVLCVSTIFSTLSLFLGAQFTASKRSDLHLKANVIAMVSNVALNYVLIKWQGINGAAYGTMLSYFIVLLYRHVKITGLIRFKVNNVKMYTACGSIMAAATYTALEGPGYLIVSGALFLLVAVIYWKEAVGIAGEIGAALKKKLKKH